MYLFQSPKPLVKETGLVANGAWMEPVTQMQGPQLGEGWGSAGIGRQGSEVWGLRFRVSRAHGYADSLQSVNPAFTAHCASLTPVRGSSKETFKVWRNERVG